MRYQPSYQRLQIGLLCAVCVMIDLRVLCKCWGLGVPGLAAVRAAQSSPPPFPPPPRRGTARPGSGWSTLRPPAAPPARWRWRPCPRRRCMRGQGRSARRTAAAPPTAQSRPLPGRHETRQLSDRSLATKAPQRLCVRAGCGARQHRCKFASRQKQTRADKSRLDKDCCNHMTPVRHRMRGAHPPRRRHRAGRVSAAPASRAATVPAPASPGRNTTQFEVNDYTMT